MKVIVTGSTGMIGEGILLECLKSPLVTEVLSVSRKPCGIAHPKMKELIVSDFLSLKEHDERLVGYDACFYCAGVSSIGMKEDAYRRMTYDTTLQFAKALGPNPTMTFMYISGVGTDSSEQGRQMWARVKGKTENDLRKLPFRQSFGFRIGMVEPAQGQRFVLKLYSYVGWMIPIIRKLAPNAINTMEEICFTMIYLSANEYDKNIITVQDIKAIYRTHFPR
jgi:uncharacterized protein YbjT (DUF2867 family)